MKEFVPIFYFIFKHLVGKSVTNLLDFGVSICSKAIQSGKRSIRVSRMLRGQMRPFCPDGRCFKNWQQWISKTFFPNRIFSILAWKSLYFCWLGYCGRPQLFISLLYLILRIFLSLSHFNFSLCLAKKTRFRK